MIASPLRALLLVALCSATTLLPAAPAVDRPGSRRIEFPDIPGYHTLKCDFHLHTVFSDGEVWPGIRVQEAERDGLDAIAITDHVEYQPHQADIPNPDRNRSFEIAAQAAAKKKAVLVLRSAEITRDLPPGHVNALFLQDVNALRRDTPLEVVREAARQGAFLLWNHPSWLDQTPDGVARVTPMHEQLFKHGVIQGIEVVNENEYSDEALQIALDHNLTIMGDSDIHGLIDWTYHVAEGGHRPVTLVFAREKTEASLKEALLERRTAVWFKNTLIGRAEWLNPLLAASLSATASTYRPDTTVVDLTLTNQTDADFVLRNVSAYRLYDSTDTLIVKAHRSLTLAVKTLQRVSRLDVAFEIMNAVTAPAVHPTLTLTVNVGEAK